jgi:hypothetical protein
LNAIKNFGKILKEKSCDQQILLKLKFKVKLTIVEDFKRKNSQKQFKSQNGYTFFNYLA